MGSNRYLMQIIICFHFQNNTTFFISRVNTTFLTSRHISSHLNYSFPHSKFHSFQFLLFKDNSPGCRKHKYFKVPLNLHADNWPQHQNQSLFYLWNGFVMGWKGKPVQYNAENNWFYRANVKTVDPVVYIVAENQHKFCKQFWRLKALSKSQNWPILKFFSKTLHSHGHHFLKINCLCWIALINSGILLTGTGLVRPASCDKC